MNKIDLHKYFIECPFNYVIIRKSKIFPNYQINTDIDILANDMKNVIDYTMKFSKKYKDLKFNPIQRPSGHFHIDIHNLDGTLNLKLDFIFDVGVYKKIALDKKLFVNILKYKIKDLDGTYIPSNKYELLIRYLEYKENIDKRPDKIKHLNYIKDYPAGEKIVTELMKEYSI
jgi:hypothetical protein